MYIYIYICIYIYMYKRKYSQLRTYVYIYIYRNIKYIYKYSQMSLQFRYSYKFIYLLLYSHSCMFALSSSSSATLCCWYETDRPDAQSRRSVERVRRETVLRSKPWRSARHYAVVSSKRASRLRPSRLTVSCNRILPLRRFIKP